VWPDPILIPLGVLNDRQTLMGNWDALGHVLVASLAARRAPADLSLAIVAARGTLERELLRLPHLLTSPVDPRDPDDVIEVMERFRHELERRCREQPNRRARPGARGARAV
jgi:hypothetical protein